MPSGRPRRGSPRCSIPTSSTRKRSLRRPLGLFAALTRGEQITNAAAVTAMTDRRTAELPRMLAEHKAITAALRELQGAARSAGDDARARLAEQIMAHLRAEEEVMYPAAILVGKYLKRVA